MSNNAQSNKEIAVAFLLDTNSGDKDRKARAVSVLAEGATWWVPGEWSLGGTFTRDQILSRLMGDVLSNFVEPLNTTIVGLTGEDNRVAMEVEINGFKKTGEPYRNFYHFLYVFEDGKISQVKAYVDTLTSYKALFGTSGLAPGAFPRSAS